MKQSKKLEGLHAQKKFTYSGKLEEFQLHGNHIHGKRYMDYQPLVLNEYQNFLYKRAVMGLKIYSPHELSSMSEDKKKRILKTNRRVQRILNVYKQEATNAITNNLFKRLFPNSPITKALEQMTDTDDTFVNKLEFKALGISKKQVIDKLICEKVLPKNFYELKSVTLHE